LYGKGKIKAIPHNLLRMDHAVLPFVFLAAPCYTQIQNSCSAQADFSEARETEEGEGDHDILFFRDGKYQILCGNTGEDAGGRTR
jgi:hypothetical protein